MNKIDAINLLSHAAEKNDPAAVRAALRHGVAVDMRNGSGYTPLLCAVFNGASEAVGTLIQAGANVNAQTSNWAGPLWHAAIKNQAECCRLLIEAGADIEMTDAGKCTPTMVATDHIDPQALKVLVAAKPDLEALSDWNETAIMMAVKSGSRSAFELLKNVGAMLPSINYGLKVMGMEHHRKTPFDYAPIFLDLALAHGIPESELLPKLRKIDTVSAKSAIAMIESRLISDNLAAGHRPESGRQCAAHGRPI